MGRTVSNIPGYALDDDEFDPELDDFVARPRNYLHFDLPLSEVERASFSVGAKDILERSFWPLLGYVTKERRVKIDPSGMPIFSKKERPIKFASHTDAAIFEFYAKDLSLSYESALSKTAFATSILAYRPNIGSNIDHAKSLFAEIKQRGNCTAIALDITGFFDHIDHRVLRDQIIRVRGVAALNNVDYKMLRRMTKFSWVDSDKLKNRLGWRFGLNGRVCNGAEFRSLVRGGTPNIVEKNCDKFGIPQGTPLSGLYANISLFEFDREMHESLMKLGGSYRRYSDDIAIVIPLAAGSPLAVQTTKDLLAKYGLELSDGKTVEVNFVKVSGTQTASKPFQYLGFTFDGKRTLIRQSSLNRYYDKMSRGIRAKVHAAKGNSVPSGEMFLRELFSKYTHFGRRRNFPRYAYKAADVLTAPEIRKQLSKHMSIFKTMLRNAIADIY